MRGVPIPIAGYFAMITDYTTEQVDKLCNEALADVERITQRDDQHFSVTEDFIVFGHSFPADEEAIFVKTERSFPL